MSSERENVPGGNLGRSDQQAEKLTDDADEHIVLVPYRVTWRRLGGEPQALLCWDEAEADTFFGTFFCDRIRRDHPIDAGLVDLALEQYIGDAGGLRWHTHLALCCGELHDSSFPDGARHISQCSNSPARRREDQPHDDAEAAPGGGGS